jgi:glycosyltransferase involved in cell wall biosynthesis
LNGPRPGGDGVPARDAAPVVSVIMPVYNGARWLAAAAESVLAQTLSAIELLIVDDASTDETARIAEHVANRDGRVRLLRLARNRGQAAARNLAIERSRGAWIAPVDADDEIQPDRLRLLVEAGERHQADFIADGILFEGARPPGAPAELMTWRCDGPGLERLSAETMILSGTGGGRCSLGYLKPLMRRRFLDERKLRYAEDLRFAEDFNLYVHALFKGARFLLYPESHYVYWQTPSSASRTEISRIARHALEGSQRLRASIPRAGAPALVRALDDYEQRWRLLCWFEQVKRGITHRRFGQLVELMTRPPASPSRILRFVRDRARLRREEMRC